MLNGFLLKLKQIMRSWKGRVSVFLIGWVCLTLAFLEPLNQDSVHFSEVLGLLIPLVTATVISFHPLLELNFKIENNCKHLLQNGWFVLSGAIMFEVAFTSWWFTWKQNQLGFFFDFTSTGWETAFSLFKFPLGCLAAGLAAMGFFATIHRSAQTARQIEKAEENANFSNFFTLRDEFLAHAKREREILGLKLSDAAENNHFGAFFRESSPFQPQWKPNEELWTLICFPTDIPSLPQISKSKLRQGNYELLQNTGERTKAIIWGYIRSLVWLLEHATDSYHLRVNGEFKSIFDSIQFPSVVGASSTKSFRDEYVLSNCRGFAKHVRKNINGTVDLGESETLETIWSAVEHKESEAAHEFEQLVTHWTIPNGWIIDLANGLTIAFIGYIIGLLSFVSHDEASKQKNIDASDKLQLYAKHAATAMTYLKVFSKPL